MTLGLGVALGAGIAVGAVAQTPKKGGILNYVVGSKIPSYDGHQETTFGMVHPIAPFYSLLIRINPENPSSPTDFVCDICEGKVPTPTDGDKTYTFKIRTGVKFHDGTPLTSADVKATYDKIINPPKGVPSSRKAFFSMVDSVTAPDATTVVFKLKYPSGAFIPALATPFNFVYSKKDLDTHGYDWHKKNVNGTGPFMFVQHQPGAFVEGKRYDGYHHKGQPYLGGFKAIAAPKMAIRMQAIRGDRAGIEFRGFPPKARDDLVKALGDKITVQEGDWNCGLFFTMNHKMKPFDDARVRRALNLAVDRWGGSKYLSRIAIVKTVGGIVFPGHPLAANKEELQQLEGYWPDIKKSRAKARELLKAAGQENLEFVLINRAVDQPYKILGTWLIDQWKQIGLKVTQNAVPTGQWYDHLRKKKDYGVAMDANCQSVVNPLVDVAKWMGSSANNYAQYASPQLDKWFDQMNREASPDKQREIMRMFEKKAVSEDAHMGITLWWYKINPHRSYVKGWKIAPSHYLNQQLDTVWLDK
jgi:peptide/nickel transport system substrate-binding protein